MSQCAVMRMLRRSGREPNSPPLELRISMGAAIQNLLLGAHATGFGAELTSGQAMAPKRLHRLCGLAEGETPVCCVNIGTVTKREASPGSRVSPSDFVPVLADESALGGV